MLIHPQIDPIALQLGPLAVHWYGLTYLAAFALFFFLATQRLKHPPFSRLSHWQVRDVEDILFAGVLGVVLGGRIGYCLFYQPGYYLLHPWEVAYVWQGGMSFHGGLVGRHGGHVVVCQNAASAIFSSDGLCGTLRANGVGRRPHWQFHQWRALGPAVRP
jgi:phosphatidylglycerol:prolipoprotein diacylglycerol transferase